MNNEEFMFNLDGLIKGEYFKIETNSKKVLLEVIKIMDSSNDRKENSK